MARLQWFCRTKCHFSFVKKCKFRQKFSHKSWISPISSTFVKNQYFRHDGQFSSFRQFFVRNDILWSLRMSLKYSLLYYGIINIIPQTCGEMSASFHHWPHNATIWRIILNYYCHWKFITTVMKFNRLVLQPHQRFIQPPRTGGGKYSPWNKCTPPLLREDHQLPPQGRSTCFVIVAPLFWVAFVGDDVVHGRGVDPYGTGDTSPQYFDWGTLSRMPPNISRVISATFYPCNIFLISSKSF